MVDGGWPMRTRTVSRESRPAECHREPTLPSFEGRKITLLCVCALGISNPCLDHICSNYSCPGKFQKLLQRKKTCVEGSSVRRRGLFFCEDHDGRTVSIESHSERPFELSFGVSDQFGVSLSENAPGVQHRALPLERHQRKFCPVLGTLQLLKFPFDPTGDPNAHDHVTCKGNEMVYFCLQVHGRICL